MSEHSPSRSSYERRFWLVVRAVCSVVVVAFPLWAWLVFHA